MSSPELVGLARRNDEASEVDWNQSAEGCQTSVASKFCAAAPSWMAPIHALCSVTSARPFIVWSEQESRRWCSTTDFAAPVSGFCQ